MLKRCPFCKKKKEMRSNQKYCSAKCKKNYENSLRNAPHKKDTKVGNPPHKAPPKPPSDSKIACPLYLNNIAAEYWHKVAPTCIARGHLNVLSEDAFAELCDIYSRLWDTNKAINETNRSLMQVETIWDNKSGREMEELKESQLSKNKRNYSRLFLEYQKQFYLTPQSNKGNFGLDMEEEEDPEEAFLSMGKK